MHACSVMSDFFQPHELGKNTGMGCLFLLQGIFPTQVKNLSLLQLLLCQADSLPLSHLGSPEAKMSAMEMRFVVVVV